LISSQIKQKTEKRKRTSTMRYSKLLAVFHLLLVIARGFTMTATRSPFNNLFPLHNIFSRDHSDDLLLLPLPSKQSKQQTAVVLLPGCQLQPQQYESVASELQKASDQAVWVAVPKLPIDMANPLVAPKAIKDALRQLQKQGYEGDKVFIGGHSLGGVFLPYVFDEKHGLRQDQVLGTIQLGSFIRKAR
jgi:poly(3-hydroxybutyrate) depolymerase